MWWRHQEFSLHISITELNLIVGGVVTASHDYVAERNGRDERGDYLS